MNQICLWVLVMAIVGLIKLSAVLHQRYGDMATAIMVGALVIAIIAIPMSLEAKNDMASGQGM